MWPLEDEPDWGGLIREMKSGRASIEFYLIAELESTIISFIEHNMSRQGRKAVIITPDELGDHLLREQQYVLYFLNDDYGSLEVLKPILGETQLTRSIPPPEIQLYTSNSIRGYDSNLDEKVKGLQKEGYWKLFYFPQFMENKKVTQSPS